jgi:hypothetical protein
VIEAEQGHDEPRRAEAALRAMMLDHCPLHRMKRFVGDVFDGDYFRAVGLTCKHDAGIDRLIDEASFEQAAQNDGASSTIALGAAFLGAGRAFLKPEIIEKRSVGREVGAFDEFAAAIKADRAAHHSPRGGDFTPPQGAILFQNQSLGKWCESPAPLQRRLKRLN